MKRLLIIIIFALASFAASAQTTITATEQTSSTSTPKTDWLVAFNRVKIDGPMNVMLKSVATANETRIVYDTKGNVTSKFKFEIDKSGTLVVSEKVDPKRTTVTEVTIYYHSLREVKISHAKSVFESVIESDLFDLSVSSGAVAILNVNTKDVAIECTGTSRLTLGGSTKYLTMRTSTAKVDCTGLSVVSATIDASHSAEVRLVIQERLEATTATGAKVLYKGFPTILRNHAAVFGGEVIDIN